MSTIEPNPPETEPDEPDTPDVPDGDEQPTAEPGEIEELPNS